jgi:hypothetical protein
LDSELSKIVSAIMENPELIEKIKSLVPNEEKENVSSEAPVTEQSDVGVSPTYTSAQRYGGARRRELLFALKPYLSEKRAKALDSMMTLGDVLEIARRH